MHGSVGSPYLCEYANILRCSCRPHLGPLRVWNSTPHIRAISSTQKQPKTTTTKAALLSSAHRRRRRPSRIEHALYDILQNRQTHKTPTLSKRRRRSIGRFGARTMLYTLSTHPSPPHRPLVDYICAYVVSPVGRSIHPRTTPKYMYLYV